jgi:hypothetical protein
MVARRHRTEIELCERMHVYGNTDPLKETLLLSARQNPER